LKVIEYEKFIKEIYSIVSNREAPGSFIQMFNRNLKYFAKLNVETIKHIKQLNP